MCIMSIWHVTSFQTVHKPWRLAALKLPGPIKEETYIHDAFYLFIRVIASKTHKSCLHVEVISMVVCMCDVKAAVKRLFTASSSRLTLESVCRGRAGATGAAAAAVFAGCKIIKLELKEMSS